MGSKIDFELLKKNIESLSDDEQERITSQLLRYILLEKPQKEIEKNQKPGLLLSENELEKIKELALRTQQLRNLLGDEPGYFF